MIPQCIGAEALRRAPSAALSRQPAPPLALASRLSMTPARYRRRPVVMEKVTRAEGQQLLVRQRLNRPLAPHLGIYKLNQTWFGASAWTRVTGVALSGSAYAYFAAYLVAPLADWHVESVSLAAGFAALPWLAKGAIKFALDFSFAFHFINGIKYLVYDLGKGFAKPAIKTGETTLWVSSILGGLYLSFGI